MLPIIYTEFLHLSITLISIKYPVLFCCLIYSNHLPHFLYILFSFLALNLLSSLQLQTTFYYIHTHSLYYNILLIFHALFSTFSNYTAHPASTSYFRILLISLNTMSSRPFLFGCCFLQPLLLFILLFFCFFFPLTYLSSLQLQTSFFRYPLHFIPNISYFYF